MFVVLAAVLAATTSPAASTCSLSGKAPVVVSGLPRVKSKVVRIDLTGPKGLLARQIVYEGDATPAPSSALLSSDPFFPIGAAPSVTCDEDNDATFTGTTVVDLGADATPKSLYLGPGSATISFYAFYEDYLDNTTTLGLANQIYSVRLDDRTPTEVQVTAMPGRDETVRFENVSPGQHKILIGETEQAGDADLWSVSFTQPSFG